MELWDIYDANKNPTGRLIGRTQCFLQPGEYHLAVLSLIRNPQGQILITRRAMSKPWGAGWWELPGGGALAGETSLQAAVRETAEETGLDVTDCEGRLVYAYRRDNPPEEGDNYFVDVWEFQKAFDASCVHVQQEEVMDFQITDDETISRLGEAGLFLHYNSIRTVFQPL